METEFAGNVYPFATGMNANVGLVVLPRSKTVGVISITAPAVVPFLMVIPPGILTDR
jgi:hypothetical protein